MARDNCGQQRWRCCQSNGNLSPLRRTEAEPRWDLSHDGPPLGQGSGPSFPVNFAANELALQVEGLWTEAWTERPVEPAPPAGPHLMHATSLEVPFQA